MISTLQTVITKSPFLAIFVVFLAGFIASLSSCTLIRIPIVFGYVSGAAGSRKHSLLLSLCLASGLIVSYTLLGILLIFLKNITFDLVRLSRYVYLALGIILLIAGFFYAGLITFGDMHASCGINNKFKKTGFVGAFIFGVMFAFLEMPACPCCASVLFVIASVAGICNSWVYSFVIFLCFAIGQSLPIFLIGSSANLVKTLAPKVERAERYIQFISGAILIAIASFFFIIA
ncbi:MAG: cytochrome c biogenesis protein CcdA [Candidatus Omnitrophota bacterium]